ncbi:MAG: hypothetical protein FJY95_15425 [Candidatus Handelsmanbacteria bacterium]|nr:hypothetical protein [Candidatus Handelsmanbacteria bacterium]
MRSPACYTEDWRRTEPDLVVYQPPRSGAHQPLYLPDALLDGLGPR